MRKVSVNFSLLLVLLLIQSVTCYVTYKKYTIDDPDALCLDGSKAAYYIKQGDQSKWMINFEGGGWCGSPAGLNQTVENCYQRSKTDLGSSKNYKDTFTYSAGILGDNANNHFRNWTIVFFKYCTGTGHQGYRKQPVNYKDATLYFRGHNTTIGMLHDLVAKHNFNNVEQIFVGGQSAGGLATYVWTEYITAFAKKLIVFDVWSVPDSGIFLDQGNYKTQAHNYKQIFLNFMQLSNKEVNPPNQACVKAYPNQVWKCMFAQYNHEFISVPLFAVQSQYDTWSLPNILGINCVSGGSLAPCQSGGVISFVEQYHQNTSAVLQKIGSNPKNGYWAPSCANHCYIHVDSFYSAAYRIPANSDNSLVKSVVDWMNKVPGNHSHSDNGNWPINRPCSGLTTSESNLLIE